MAPQTSPPPPQTPPAQPPQPFMVQVSPPAHEERGNLKDVLVGSFGLTGALVIAAVVSGLVLGSIWILVRRWRRTYDTDAPPSIGSVPLGPSTSLRAGPAKRPPSSPDQ